MRYTSLELKEFWELASKCPSMIVVGGGRWGRVWASIITNVRGTCDGLIMVSRQDPNDLKLWLDKSGMGNTVYVMSSIEEAFDRFQSPAAIIASRPSNHVADGIAALRCGAHILVEKPLSSDLEEASTLLDIAQSEKRVLAVGTEFSFLPAFHQCAASLGTFEASPVRLRLIWDDLLGEIRHGKPKIWHNEIGIIEDIMPHALSVFRVFSPEEEFQIAEVRQNMKHKVGQLILSTLSGGHYELLCNAQAKCRRRYLEIEIDQKKAVVDFSGNTPSIHINGNGELLQYESAQLKSTLRLELGAWIGEILGLAKNTPITRGIEEQVSLAKQIGRHLHQISKTRYEVSVAEMSEEVSLG